MTFAEKLKAARAEAGLSQVKLAKATGIPRRTIEAWESEKEAGREPNEWTQRLVLDEIARIRNVEDIVRLFDYLTENEQVDEQLMKDAGLETRPRDIIERMAKDAKKRRE